MITSDVSVSVCLDIAFIYYHYLFTGPVQVSRNTALCVWHVVVDTGSRCI